MPMGNLYRTTAPRYSQAKHGTLSPRSIQQSIDLEKLFCDGFLFAQRGAPVYVKSDNGPEFIAQRVTICLRTQRIGTHFIALGSVAERS